jgi:hypothetical protein
MVRVVKRRWTTALLLLLIRVRTISATTTATTTTSADAARPKATRAVSEPTTFSVVSEVPVEATGGSIAGVSVVVSASKPTVGLREIAIHATIVIVIIITTKVVVAAATATSIAESVPAGVVVPARAIEIARRRQVLWGSGQRGRGEVRRAKITAGSTLASSHRFQLLKLHFSLFDNALDVVVAVVVFVVMPTTTTTTTVTGRVIVVRPVTGPVEPTVSVEI